MRGRGNADSAACCTMMTIIDSTKSIESLLDRWEVNSIDGNLNNSVINIVSVNNDEVNNILARSGLLSRRP